MKVRSTPVADSLAVAGNPDLLVLKDEVLIRLGPLGRRIFESAVEARTLDELREEAVAAFGATTERDADAAIVAAVQGLLDAGLLERADD